MSEQANSAAAAITTGDIFEQVGDTLSGMFTACGNVFTSLWAHPMGKIVVTLGLASAAVGLCYKLFLRKKHM